MAVVPIIRIIQFLGETVPLPVPIYGDNKSAITCVYNVGKSNSRFKHIDIRFHKIREYAQAGLFIYIHCPTEEMPADLLTKPLSREPFSYHQTTLNLL